MVNVPTKFIKKSGSGERISDSIGVCRRHLGSGAGIWCVGESAGEALQRFAVVGEELHGHEPVSGVPDDDQQDELAC